MNKKLLRVLDEIDRTEAKIAEWQEHLKHLHEQRVQMEEKEIVRGVRAMKLTSRELLSVVDGLCAGSLTLVSAPDGAGMSGMAGMAESGILSGAAAACGGFGAAPGEEPPGSPDTENTAGTAGSGMGMERQES